MADHSVQALYNKGMQLKPSPMTGKPMRHLDLGLAHVDVCDDTGGIWFDLSEFGLLIRQRPDALIWLEEEFATKESDSAPALPTKLRCPNDQHDLVEYRYISARHVPLMCCEKCGGLWFDEGELGETLDSASRRMEFWQKHGMPPEVLDNPEVRTMVEEVAEGFRKRAMLLHFITASSAGLNSGIRRPFNRLVFQDAVKKLEGLREGVSDPRLRNESSVPVVSPEERAKAIEMARQSLEPVAKPRLEGPDPR